MQTKQSISVHKFGGASVRNAEAVRNVSKILRKRLTHNESAVVVVSAIGKTTNALEEVYRTENTTEARAKFDEIVETHLEVVRKLSLSQEVEEGLKSVFESTFKSFEKIQDPDVRFDELVAVGEDASTRILKAYLKSEGWDVIWWDVRKTLVTDERHRAARVDEVEIEAMGSKLRKELTCNEGLGPRVVVTQGFIGRSSEGLTTTLGREGSDYSAALLACATGAGEVVIWKDVPGMLNADPKIFPDTFTVEELDYAEALELSYYGASVIHPRTVKPLQNRKIPLLVKSFINSDGPSTRIDAFPGQVPSLPMYISRPGQTCLSLGPSDRSFVGEDHLETVFGALSKSCIHVRMMQNSAVQFDLVFDEDPEKRGRFIKALGERFWTQAITGLDLLTVRHGTTELVEQLTKGREIVMEQKNPLTIRRLLKS